MAAYGEIPMTVDSCAPNIVCPVTEQLLLVSVESPWPTVHGGRLRTARIAEGLSSDFQVKVAFPRNNGEVQSPPAGIEPIGLPGPVERSFRDALHLGPRLGHHWLRLAQGALAPLQSEVDVVLFSHSYLAAVTPTSHALRVVDFANLEHRRMRSLARSATGSRRLAKEAEAMKARFWERRVAKQADVCVALSDEDAQWISSCARNVVIAKNGVDVLPYSPSPPDGPVVFAASFTYDPNREAALRFLSEVWPALRRLHPGVRLEIVGRGAEQALGANLGAAVAVHTDVISVRPYVAGAAIMIAPVVAGGGAQLKVTEALGSHRVVVVTPHSARSAPAAALAAGAVVPADWENMAESLDALLRDVKRRWSLERQAATFVPSWEESIAPVIAEIRRQRSA